MLVFALIFSFQLNKDAQRIYKACHFLMNNLWISGFKKYALQYFENYTVLL